MKKPHTRHDRLAVRLSVMISRLLAGETLNLGALAEEFGVSERTLQRDLHERLLHLDLIHHNGHYSMPGNRIRQHSPDILTFTRNTGIAAVFPGQHRRLVNTIAASKDMQPCVISLPELRFSATVADCFHRLLLAITQSRRIILFTDGEQYVSTEPYQLIFQKEAWYLVAWCQDAVQVFALDDIDAVIVMEQVFSRRRDISALAAQARFIAALPYFRVIHEVQATLNQHGDGFDKRNQKYL
nr:WYL domain-containing protein [uncultured Enterobacter sp.]